MRPPISSLFPYTTLFRSTTLIMLRAAVQQRTLSEGGDLIEWKRRCYSRSRIARIVHWRCLCRPSHSEHFHYKRPDRKSTRLNSSHITISYAVFCLKKKKH